MESMKLLLLFICIKTRLRTPAQQVLVVKIRKDFEEQGKT